MLVVDDDATTRSIARAMLAAQGYKVSEAIDGLDAMEQFDRLRDVGIVVLDLAMPRMDGREVLRRLGANVVTTQLPVVVLTGSMAEKTEIELMEAGADDYVRKPIEPERFLARVKAALRRASH